MPQIFFAHPDPKLVQIYQAHLTKYFEFDSAHDGLAAVRKMRLMRPNIIVSSYELPKLSGLALLKFVRSSRELATVPFIFFSPELDASSSLGLGASDWLRPDQTTPDALLERIYYHIRINQSVLN